MKITNQLSQPLFERIAKEYHDLMGELNGHFSEDAVELRNFIQKKLRQLEMVQVSLSYMSHVSNPDPIDMRDTLRQLKLELRFARRRWKRHLISQERVQRNLARRNHVPTFAA